MKLKQFTTRGLFFLRGGDVEMNKLHMCFDFPIDTTTRVIRDGRSDKMWACIIGLRAVAVYFPRTRV